MLLWLAGLETIPRPLYEAAAVDGATPFQTFVFITLPNLLPTVVLTTILSLVNSFKVFREAYLVAGNYPQESIYLLQHLFNNWFLSLDIGKLSAAAVLLAGYEKDKAGAIALLADFRAAAAAGVQGSKHSPVQGETARKALGLADTAIWHLSTQVNPKITLSVLAANFRTL